LASEN